MASCQKPTFAEVGQNINNEINKECAQVEDSLIVPCEHLALPILITQSGAEGTGHKIFAFVLVIIVLPLLLTVEGKSNLCVRVLVKHKHPKCMLTKDATYMTGTSEVNAFSL